MSLLFKKYKMKFRYLLRPFFIMINGKRKAMNHDEWTSYLQQIKKDILCNPEEFLGPDRPDQRLTENIIDDVFQEYIKEREYLEHGSHKAH